MSKKVSEILDSVQLRLGMLPGSDGWVIQRPIVHDMLQTSVELMDEDFRQQLRFVPNRLLTSKSTGSYDNPETVTTFTVPDDCDPLRINDLSVQYSGYWRVIPKGITDDMRDRAYTPQSTYSAWEVIECGEIEVWPHSIEPWPVRISYTKTPADYADENVCIDADAQLLILMTLDIAIPFYGRPGEESNNRKLNRHLGNIRAKQLDGYRFFKNSRLNLAGTPDGADDVYRYPGP